MDKNMKYFTKSLNHPDLSFYSDSLVDLMEQVKHYYITHVEQLEWDQITFVNSETKEVVDRLKYSRDLFSNGTHFRMVGGANPYFERI